VYFLNPIELATSVYVPGETELIKNSPSALEGEPIVVPSKPTFTPIRGSLVTLSITLPLTWADCPKAFEKPKKEINSIKDNTFRCIEDKYPLISFIRSASDMITRFY
jgi:hypothetical protein